MAAKSRQVNIPVNVQWDVIEFDPNNEKKWIPPHEGRTRPSVPQATPSGGDRNLSLPVDEKGFFSLVILSKSGEHAARVGQAMAKERDWVFMGAAEEPEIGEVSKVDDPSKQEITINYGLVRTDRWRLGFRVSSEPQM